MRFNIKTQLALLSITAIVGCSASETIKEVTYEQFIEKAYEALALDPNYKTATLTRLIYENGKETKEEATFAKKSLGWVFKNGDHTLEKTDIVGVRISKGRYSQEAINKMSFYLSESKFIAEYNDVELTGIEIFDSFAYIIEYDIKYSIGNEGKYLIRYE